MNSLVINPFPPTSLRRRHAQTVRDSSSSYKNRLCQSDQDISKSRRASKYNQWFKIYGHFTEGMDFACFWSFSGGGSAINGATTSIFLLFKLWCLLMTLVSGLHRGPAPLYSYPETDLPSGISS